MFRGFERRILRMFYCPINGNGVWRAGHNIETYIVYDESDIDRVVKIGRLMVAGTPL